ncbi:n-acetyltransferase 9 protein [Apiospora kogelbergensis]|uniref:N-acetyltransferase 9 protein n=1 Tax=Apiospora kogelbergensis TaxID=1337665 RepID=A0AAW0QNQ8_9PEZI
MPATEFVWLTARETSSTSQRRIDAERAVSVQNEWFSRTGPGCHTPGATVASGVALFQQIEDAALYLITGRSASIEQYQQWQRSDEATSITTSLESHFIREKTVSILVEDDGSAIFTSTEVVANTPLMESPVMSVGRCTVAAPDRSRFAENWDSVRGLLEAFAQPHSVKGVWRIRKDQGEDNTRSDEEFVMLCGWPSVERHMEFSTREEFQRYSTALKEKLKGADIKHYRRVL